MAPRNRTRSKNTPPRGARGLRGRLEVLTAEAILAMVAVVLGAFLLSGFARYFLGTPQTAAVVSAILVELTNGDRAANDLGALQVNAALTAAAQAKADDMAAQGYFAHTSPEGKDPWYWFQLAGYQFSYAGENLAVDFSDSADVERAWMNSPEHRANILDPHYTQIGIAIASGMYQGRPTIFVVQEFGTPVSSAEVSNAQAIATSSVPKEPTAIATAEAPRPRVRTAPASTPPATTTLAQAPTPGVRILGSEAQATSSSAEITLSSASAPIPASSFGVALASPISYAIGAPHDALRAIYVVLALFLLAALAYTTRFEMKLHHLRHVGAVTGLVFIMGFLFIASGYAFFAPPQLLDQSAAAIRVLR